MTPTMNTLLSFLLGSVCGALAMAFWMGAAKGNQAEEREFDERDIYSRPPLKKVK